MEVGNEIREKSKQAGKKENKGKRIVLRALRPITAWVASEKTKLVAAMLLPLIFFLFFFPVKKFRRGVGWEDV